MKTFLIVTSIASDSNPVLRQLASEAELHGIPFIVVGDLSSPATFSIPGCTFLAVEDQKLLPFSLTNELPYRSYARKNLGYLKAMSEGAEIIIETDDDNIPLHGFWDQRHREVRATPVYSEGWVNVYRYFTKENIWPRGLSLEHIEMTGISETAIAAQNCPIQQGLADDNPDVDAIYRLTLPLPVRFENRDPVLLQPGAFSPFNSQNTTWFKEAFPLMYLPSFCSFRMTDIWRSFVAQRVAWTCGWGVLFHQSTMRQERNQHQLLKDFGDEIPGYLNNHRMYEALESLDLVPGPQAIGQNMIHCYETLIGMNIIGTGELDLLHCWLNDIARIFPE